MKPPFIYLQYHIYFFFFHANFCTVHYFYYILVSTVFLFQYFVYIIFFPSFFPIRAYQQVFSVEL